MAVSSTTSTSTTAHGLHANRPVHSIYRRDTMKDACPLPEVRGDGTPSVEERLVVTQEESQEGTQEESQEAPVDGEVAGGHTGHQLVYGVEDTPPLLLTFFIGLQVTRSCIL